MKSIVVNPKATYSMSVIVYKKYFFKEPGPITDEQFVYLKRQIAANADFEIIGDSRTSFVSHYKNNLRWLLIGLIVFINALLLYRVLFGFKQNHSGGGELIVLLAIIAGGATVLASLLRLFLEAPSMATFLTDRRFYFIRMKHAIRHFSDYPDFYSCFYGDGKKALSGINAPFRKEAQEEEKQAPASLERFLTRLFNLIDLHMWKVILVIIAVVLFKKYVLR